MTKTLKFFLYLLLILFIGACSGDSLNESPDEPTPPTEENDSENIIILHMNDMHADINNFPKIAAYINKLKEEEIDIDELGFNDELTENIDFSPNIFAVKSLLESIFSENSTRPFPSVISSFSSRINKETSCNSAEPE